MVDSWASFDSLHQKTNDLWGQAFAKGIGYDPFELATRVVCESGERYRFQFFAGHFQLQGKIEYAL